MNDIANKTLLLVEDEAIIALMEMQLLEREGYQVIHAMRGEEAINIVKNQKIDLILMDIDLGAGIDGTRTALEILKIYDLPIVFLSSRTEKETIQKTEKITSYGYIVKSSDITVIDASIKMAFKLFEANKRTEKEREQLDTILHSIGDAVIATDTKGKIIKMNPVAEDLTGWNFREAEGKPLNEIFEIVNAKTRNIVQNPVESVLATGTIVGLANHTILISKNKKEFQIADSGSPIKDSNGKIIGVVLVFRDVTQEYEIQSRIEESEKLYHSLFENMLNGFAYYKMIFEDGKPVDFIYLSINNALERLTGLKDIVGKKVSEIFPGIRERDPKLFEIFGRVSLTGIPEIFETFVESLNMWFAISVYSTKKEYFVTIFDVITERKRIEEKLLYQANMLSVVNDAVTAADDKFIITYWNRAAEKIFGWKSEEAIGEFGANLLRTEFIGITRSEVNEILTKTGGFFGEIIQYRKDGTLVFIEANSLVIKDNLGKVSGYVTVSRDITERKNAELALRASEEKYSILFKKATIPAALTKIPENTFVDVNDAFETIFEYNRLEVIGKTSVELGIVRPEDQRPSIESINKKGFDFNSEKRIRTKSGKLRVVLVNIERVAFGGNNYVITTMQDITESKLAEEKVQKLLEEKEIILKEVHHRIKNNMHTIMSLLSIQSTNQENQDVKRILLDAANRIKSMMIMYDKLYRSENTTEIHLKEYLVTLVDEIVSGFPQKAFLKIKTQIEDIIVAPKIVSPLGIILNELITNSMKYAFNEVNHGILSISVSKDQDQILVLFEDNGPGIPESITLENSKGFGLQLINMQVRQLKGSVRIERENGTRFIIEIDV